MPQQMYNSQMAGQIPTHVYNRAVKPNQPPSINQRCKEGEQWNMFAPDLDGKSENDIKRDFPFLDMQV
eukprot:5582166-Ditylum_brightwellii.AAC.1